jgi:hypothetical protein
MSTQREGSLGQLTLLLAILVIAVFTSIRQEMRVPEIKPARAIYRLRWVNPANNGFSAEVECEREDGEDRDVHYIRAKNMLNEAIQKESGK